MKRLEKILEYFIKVSKQSRTWRTFVFCLAAIVVFSTTYSLILPAITVEKSATENVGGLVTEEADPGSTGAEAEAPGGVMTADAENETPDETLQEEVPDASSQTPSSENDSSENGTTQPASSQTQTAQTAESTAAVDEEVKEPVNGEVQTVGDRRIMTLRGEDFDVVVSGDLSVGVSDGTVLSVRGISDADVVRSFSDRITDELYKNFVDTKTTEVLYQLVFTDKDLVEYSPAGNFDVQFIFHNNTVSHTDEVVYAAIYDYLTDEMVLTEKNGDAYETPVISFDEYGIITGITLKGLNFGEYSDIITLVAGPVNEERKLAAEQAADSKNESGTESAKSETEKTESAGTKTDSADSKSNGPSAKAETSKESKKAGNGTLTARGSDYTVTLAYSAEAEIPANAVLEVTEIENGTAAYKKYLEQAKAAMGLDKDQVLPKEQARFFDIRIMADGKEVQPAANVSVNITYDQPVAEADPGAEAQIDASAVHFGKEGAEVVEVSDSDASRVEFEAESFSVYGIIYTVDFEYTDPTTGGTYYYSLNGGDSITLTELLVVLGIKGEDEAVKFVAEEVENVEFSDPELVKVTHKGKILGVFGSEDWLLECLKPFDTEEALTISLRSGEKIVIKVTDDNSEVDPNDGIKSLLTDVTITGAKLENGKYIFYAGQPYGITLTFKEENRMNGQFPMDQSFTYQLPSGLMPEGSSVSGTFPIELKGGEHAGETVNLNYTVSDSGLIVFTWDSTTYPGAFNQLKEALYTQFKGTIECVYNGDSGTLDFGNSIEKDVEVRNEGTVNLNKKGNYNAKTNCIDYTVTVSADGICRNIVVSDTVSGTALTYKKDATARSNTGREVPDPDSGSNGFSLTIPQMSDGETVTISYSAAVNLDQLHQNPDGSWGTLEETGNKVTITKDGEPEGEKEISGKDFENKISLSDISKSGTALETDENGHAKINWTIRANTNANVSMAGHTISDSIDNNSVPMTYEGDGIYVSAYYSDGSPAYENKLVSWGEMTSTDTSWSWRVPDSYPDNQKLSYIISYQTDADVHDRLIKTTVSNKTTSDNGGTGYSGVEVEPYGGAVTGRKKVINTDLTANTVTWEVSFDVPETGLDSARIVDTVPTYYDTSGTLAAVDNYIEGSVTVTPELEGGESYEVTPSTDSNGKEYITIEFFKTVDEQKVTGLTGTGSKRRIRVQFQTEIDGTWKQAAIDHPDEYGALNHINSADIIVNDQIIQTSASTRVDGGEPGMNKVHGNQTYYIIDGNRLPAYPFVLTLQGITDEMFDENGVLTVEDTFNSKYLAYYPESQTNPHGDNLLVGYMYGALQYRDLSKGEDPINNSQKKSESKVVSSPEDGKILITITRDNIPVDANENFYPYYYVYYYLTVKDSIALGKLENAIQTSESGVYHFLNKATNKNFGTVTDEFGFEIPVVDKSIINPDGKPGKQNEFVYYENGNYVADYKIDVNPNALSLGYEEELTLIDDYENLAIDYTTIKIQKEVNGSLVDITEADGVSWDRKGNRVTYFLRNGTHYVITYSARITGEAADNGEVTYSNTVEFFGVKDWETHTQNIRSSGGGDSITYGITVFKHARNAGSAPLQGAKFKLYKYNVPEDKDSWENRPEATIDEDQPGWIYVRDLTTGPDGVAKTRSSDQIQRWTWYKLIETEAPTVDGQTYQKKDFAYVFWITDENKADYGHYVFLNDDVVAIDNEPVLPEKVTIGVTKTWSNDNGDKTNRKDITVRLFADGVPYGSWMDKDGNHLPVRNDTVKVLPLKEDGTIDGYEWTDLQSGPVYSVVEDGVAGYTTTYSPRSTQTGGTINIQNKYIPDKTYIHVEKVWSDKLDQNTRAEDITVQLKRKVMPNAVIQFVQWDGEYLYSDTVAPGSTVNISFKEKNSSATRGYTVREGMGTGGRILDQKSTLWSGDGSVLIENVTVTEKGITIQFPNDGFQWSNLENLPTITVVTPPADLTYKEDADFNNENRFYTINADNNWKIDIDRLVKEDEDGKYVYYIEEVGVNDNTETPEEAGYKVTYTNNEGIEGGTGNETLDTITVTNAPQTVDVEFEKEWVNTQPEGVSAGMVNDTSALRVVIQLERWYQDENGEEHKIDDLYNPITLFGDTTTYLDQGYPESYAETTDPVHGNNWSAKFSELPKKGQVDGKTVEYIYKIVETRAVLSSDIDSGNTDLIKLGIIHSSMENGSLFSSATNTFPKTSVEVEKKWADKDGNSVTAPEGVTVTVQLQRRQRDLSADYDYSGDIHPGEWSNYSDVSGKTITLKGDTWTGSFADLPVYGWHKDDSTDNRFSFLEYEYQVIESSVTINNKPADKHFTTAVEMQDVGQNDKKAVITNTEIETVEYEVTKIWKDSADNNADWVKDITIILHKKAGTEETFTYLVREITDDFGNKSYAATSEQEGAPLANVTGNAADGYTIKWDTLEAGFDYWTTEEKVDGYEEPEYAILISKSENGVMTFANTDSGETITSAGNKGYIINRPVDSAALPYTGGMGTAIFYIVGAVLLIGAGILLVTRRRMSAR